LEFLLQEFQQVNSQQSNKFTESELVADFLLRHRLTLPLNQSHEAVLVSQVYSDIHQVLEESQESHAINADEMVAPSHRDDT